jgi:hypothetical protein
MAKVKLVFKLPEEEPDFLNAVNGIRYKMALSDLDNFLRSKIRYEDSPHHSYEEIRNKLHEFLGDLEI